MASPMKLRVILGENNCQKLVLPNGMPESIGELSQEIKTQCGVEGDFRLKYMDAEFGNEFMNLKLTSDVKDKDTIKLFSTQTYTVSASKHTAEPAGNMTYTMAARKQTAEPAGNNTLFSTQTYTMAASKHTAEPAGNNTTHTMAARKHTAEPAGNNTTHTMAASKHTAEPAGNTLFSTQTYTMAASKHTAELAGNTWFAPQTYTMAARKQTAEPAGNNTLFGTQTDTMSASKQTAEPAGNTTTKVQMDKMKFTVFPGDDLLSPVRLLNLKKARDGHLNKKVFGSPPTNKPSNKTIMVVGATGSGKTTLINGMINYVLGVEWKDNWRYKLIDEQTHTTQANSQTSEVTAYEIYHTDGFKVPFSLTIIDTPGFGDTRGIKQDKEITEKIRKFFSVKGGIDTIDAVCFVVQSALARLTHTQKYIFDAILSIFGKDIATNIIVLVTFADGKSPPVLEAIKAANIPCASNPDDGSLLHFKFNNSVLFANNTGASSDEDNFDYMFWKMGKASMNKFFTHLNLMKPQSLTLTKEVLNERRQLEATVEGVQPKIRLGLSKLEEINTTKDALQNCETHMKENKDFDYVVIVDKSDKINIPPGTFITNCHTCNFTCHYPCGIPKDADKSGCAAMRGGKCTVCPGKCHWSDHYNMTYRWEIKREPEKRTYLDLKKKYEEALGGKMNKEKIIKHLELEYEQMQREVVEMMTTLTKSLQRLREIALRPDPLATPDYIDMLIQTEQQEAKRGYQKRIQELQEVRERAVLLKKVTEGVAEANLTGKEKSILEKMKSTAKGIFNLFAIFNAS